MITYTNQQRARNGLPAFITSAQLMDAAAIQARQMASSQRLDHVQAGAQYPTVESRLQAVGYVYRDAAENIAWNQPDARAVLQSWMASPGHRANILDPQLTQIGAAMARSSKGEPYWVQVFGTPR
ncbi:MAG TPA: CAP domain-containing protein [Gemmatimonadaceae bacterium]|nr:CAP domain-containing protein [Gemmatimonadaceae bacterium]